MRKTAIVSLLAIVPVLASATEYPSYASVTNLWWNGYKTNVLAIAERRLEANTNDFVGLILEMEYHMAYMEIDDFTNVASRVFSLAPTIQGQAFSPKKELYNVIAAFDQCGCILFTDFGGNISREKKRRHST